jgi:hypothetical protein
MRRFAFWARIRFLIHAPALGCSDTGYEADARTVTFPAARASDG